MGATLRLNGGFYLGGRQVVNRSGYINLYGAGTLGNAQVTNLGGFTYLLGSSTAANAAPAVTARSPPAVAAIPSSGAGVPLATPRW